MESDMGETFSKYEVMTNAYTVLVRKPERKEPCVRLAQPRGPTDRFTVVFSFLSEDGSRIQLPKRRRFYNFII
jgi:hypothetical protein